MFRTLRKELEHTPLWMLFDDANTWVKPWTFGMRLTRDDDAGVFEYACHEGNHALPGILGGARAEEAKEASAGKKSARKPVALGRYSAW